jgi:hypothetical protein
LGGVGIDCGHLFENCVGDWIGSEPREAIQQRPSPVGELIEGRFPSGQHAARILHLAFIEPLQNLFMA